MLSLNPLAWAANAIRERVRAAVVDGLADGFSDAGLFDETPKEGSAISKLRDAMRAVPMAAISASSTPTEAEADPKPTRSNKR